MSIPEQFSSLDRFCQYLWVADSLPKWRTVPDLKRNFEKYQQHHCEFAFLCQTGDDNAIALFWREMVLNDSPSRLAWETADHRQQLALQHLSAFLDRACYIAAQSFHDQQTEFYRRQTNFKVCSLEECLATVREKVSHADSFLGYLRRYNAERNQRMSLTNYFQKFIFKEILQEKLNPEGKFSKWRRLYKSSKQSLKNALNNVEHDGFNVDRLIFAWKEFRRIYYQKQVADKSKGKTWPDPNSETYAEAVRAYNSGKLHISASATSLNSPDISVEELEEWMNRCIEVLIHYRTRDSLNRSDSLNKQIPGQNDSQSLRELIDTIKDEKTEEPQGYSSKFKPVSNRTFSSIEKNIERCIQAGKVKKYYRSLPFLRYGLDIKQIPLEKYYGVHQSNISNHLKKYYERPLRQAIDTEAKLKDETVKSWIKQWLGITSAGSNIPELIASNLDKATKSLKSDQLTIWELHYRKKLSISLIARQTYTSEEEIRKQILQIEADFEKNILKEIERTYGKYTIPYLNKVYRERLEPILKQAVQLQQDREKKVRAKLELTDVDQVRDYLLDWLQNNLDLPPLRVTEHSEIDRSIEQWLKENQ